MTAIRSYTDISQSKKLADILPLESADMGWYYSRNPQAARNQMWVGTKSEGADIPCWSLAALLENLPKIIKHETLFIKTSALLWHIGYRNIYIARTDNLLDACYEMIIKLHQQKLL